MNRLGRLAFNYDDLTQNADKYADLLASIRFLPYAINMAAFNGRIEYTGYSPLFDETEEEGAIPAYDLLFGKVTRKQLNFIKKG
jgi:hypothetical protein